MAPEPAMTTIGPHDIGLEAAVLGAGLYSVTAARTVISVEGASSRQ